METITIFNALMPLKEEKEKSYNCGVYHRRALNFDIKRFENVRKTTEFCVYATTYNVILWSRYCSFSK